MLTYSSGISSPYKINKCSHSNMEFHTLSQTFISQNSLIFLWKIVTWYLKDVMRSWFTYLLHTENFKYVRVPHMFSLAVNLYAFKYSSPSLKEFPLLTQFQLILRELRNLFLTSSHTYLFLITSKYVIITHSFLKLTLFLLYFSLNVRNLVDLLSCKKTDKTLHVDGTLIWPKTLTIMD